MYIMMAVKIFFGKREHSIQRFLAAAATAALLFPVFSSAGMVTHTIEYSTEDLIYGTTERGYDIIGLPDAVTNGRAGAPQLPSVPLHFVIPANAALEKVEIAEIKTVAVPGIFKIAPIQEAVPFSRLAGRPYTAPNPQVYESSALYPAENITNSSTGELSGFTVVGISYFPLRYRPAEGRLFLTTRATISVHYTTAAAHSATMLSQRQYAAFEPVVRALIHNPGVISRYKPSVRPDKITDVNYAIIADASLTNEFTALKDWKTRKGFNAGVFSTSWISSTYQGYDLAEKIRNFLVDYFKNKGLVYALLAGDNDKVPERDIAITVFGTQPHDGKVASDLYYSDLTGTWDANNNHSYGERQYDNIDGRPDIFTGRVPVDNIENVKTFIYKDTVTEKHPPAAGQKRFLLFSVPMGGSINDHLKNLNTILKDSVTPGWHCPNIQYQTENDKTTIRDSLNKGFSLCHIASHGMNTYFCVDGQKQIFTTTDVSQMTNGDKLPVLFSMACFTGCFDHPSNESIAEELLKKANGGCVAAVLNAREGLGDVDLSTGKIIMGFSEQLCITFNANIFKRNEYVLGKAHASTKNRFASLAWNTGQSDSYDKWAWVCGEWTLFGDPDLPVFTEIPAPLSATHASSAGAGTQSFTVTVLHAGAPVPGAYVCCYKEGEVHQTGLANASGQVSLQINPSTKGAMLVTATAQNFTPYEGVCAIGESGIGHVAFIGTASCIARLNAGRMMLTYTVHRQTPVKAALFRSSGRRIKVLEDRICAPGSYQVQVDETSLARGVYILKFTAGEYHTMEKLFIVE